MSKANPFDQAHKDFVRTETAFQQGTSKLDDVKRAFNKLKVVAPGAITRNPDLHRVLADAANRMRSYERGGQLPSFASRHLTPEARADITVLCAIAEVSIMEAEVAAAGGDFDQAESHLRRATQQMTEIDAVRRKDSDEQHSIKTSQHLRELFRRIQDIRSMMRQLENRPVIQRSAARRRLGILRWFILLALVVSGFDLIGDLLDGLWDISPVILFLMPILLLLGWSIRRR